MEPPKLVYLQEHCQLTSHKNSRQVQSMLPEDAKNIISFVRKFDTLPHFSFKSATCPYKPFNHKINLHCP